MLKRLLLVAVVLFFLCQTSGIQAQMPPNFVVLEHSWGGEGNVFNQTRDVSVSPTGQFYVANRGFHRITRVDPTEDSYISFGYFGAGEGQLMDPNGIHVHGDGTVYVAGYGSISHFSADGVFLDRISDISNLAGQWDMVNDVVVDANGIIYAVTGESGAPMVWSVKIFNPDGSFQSSWSTVNGKALDSPNSIELDSGGNLLIADVTNNRILRCKPDGTFLNEYDGASSTAGTLKFPTDITEDTNGNIYIAEMGSNRVHVIDSSFGFVSAWNPLQSSNGAYVFPTNLSFIQDGNLLISDGSSGAVMLYQPDGTLIKNYGIDSTALGQFVAARDILTSQTEKVFVVDSGNYRVQVFDAYGTVSSVWTDFGPTMINSNYIVSLAEDSLGNIYLADASNNRVSKLDQGGKVLTVWGQAGASGGGNFINPQAIAIAEVPVGTGTQEQVFVADGSGRIQVFDTNGIYIHDLDITATGGPSLVNISDMDIDSNGILYLLNNRLDGNCSLEIFDYTGAYIESIDYTDFYIDAISMTIGPHGDLYLVYPQVMKIVRLDTTTHTISGEWASNPDDANTRFWHPEGISFSADGKLYLTDTGNSRISVFTLPEPTLQGSAPQSLQSSSPQATVPVPNGDFEAGLSFPGWTYTGIYPAAIASASHSGTKALQLGSNACSGDGYAQAYTTLKVPYSIYPPALSFYYQVETVDPNLRSDLYVEIQDGVGLSQLIEVKQAGDTNASVDGSWKQGSISLAGYEGETVRLSFMARCRFDDSVGVLARIDDVTLENIGFATFLPIVTH